MLQNVYRKAYNLGMTGKEIKKLRKYLKLSQGEFGKKISEILGQDKPIIHTTIYRWESGFCKPRDKFLEAIEKIKLNNFFKIRE